MIVLRRSGVQALKALLELANEPSQWRSVSAIDQAQALPAPMLEQLVLQLRRAGLVEARRGRWGGYRLGQSPSQIKVSAVLEAVGSTAPSLDSDAAEGLSAGAEDRVLLALQRRLQRALERELAELSLEELIFDLRSWQETLGNGGGLMLG